MSQFLENLDTLNKIITDLRTELAAEREKPQDLTWFWEIVDRDGLNNVCSDERGALAELVRYAAERDELLEELKDARNKIRQLERTIIMGERG